MVSALPGVWVAQAASLLVAAACRGHSLRTDGAVPVFDPSRVPDVSGRLPETAGWQPALPRIPRSAHVDNDLRGRQS